MLRLVDARVADFGRVIDTDVFENFFRLLLLLFADLIVDVVLADKGFFIDVERYEL